MSFKITGLNEGFQKISEKRLKQNLEKNVRRALNRSGLVVEGKAKERIQRGPHSGKIYEKYNPRRTHRASAAGESPATDTGFLVSNISHKAVTREGKGLEMVVASSAPYSEFLEFGTRYIEERPFLQPALEDSADAIEKIFASESLIKK